MSWKEMLESCLAEEAEGMEKYLAIAEMAKKDGCHWAAGVLRDIANEEETHHKLLADMLHAASHN